MSYSKLLSNLYKYGRDTNFAYVCDSFKPYLRQDSKFIQWKRLVNVATLKSFTPNEKRILGLMLECKVVQDKYIHGNF